MDEALGNVNSSANQPAYINPNLDSAITSPKQKAELNAKFEDFWKQEDAKAAAEPPQGSEEFKDLLNRESPSAPQGETPAAREPLPAEVEAPKEDLPKSKGRPGKRPPSIDSVLGAVEDAVVPNHEQEPVDQRDIDSLELHAGASPEQKGQFANVKSIAKTFREKTQTYGKHITPLANKYGVPVDLDDPEKMIRSIDAAIESRFRQLQTLPADVQQELEDAWRMQRECGIRVDGSIFRTVKKKYHALLDEMAPYFTSKPAAQIKAEFTDPMKAWDVSDMTALTDKWWREQIQATGTDQLTMERLYQKVIDLSGEIDKAKKELEEYSKNPGSIQKAQERLQKDLSQDYAFQIRNEVERQIAGQRAHLKPLQPKDTNGITDPEKLAEINAHNLAFAEKEREFSQFISQFNSGPRAAANCALDFIEMRIQLPQLQKEVTEKADKIKTLEVEVKKLKDEVTSKRKVSDAPLRNGAGVGIGKKPDPAKKKLSESTGRRGLEDAFKDLPQG